MLFKFNKTLTKDSINLGNSMEILRRKISGPGVGGRTQTIYTGTIANECTIKAKVRRKGQR